MDNDAGNALSAVMMKEKDKETTGKDGEVDLEKAEVDISRPQTPGMDGGIGGDVPLEPVFSRVKELPFSKARLVALVVTLTGAAFLNVSISNRCSSFEFYSRWGADSICRHWVYKLLSSSSRV